MSDESGRAFLLLRIAAVLWGIWGVFHLLMGIVGIGFFATEHPAGMLSAVPTTLEVTMMGNDAVFPIMPALKQHMFNLAWIGAGVTVGAVYMWKRRWAAIFACAFLGGLADVGYFVFVDLPGYAEAPGPQMTYIALTAVVLSFVAYFRNDAGSSRMSVAPHA